MAELIDKNNMEEIFYNSDPVKMSKILREIMREGIDYK
jgi:hypothetical protein